jgi:hypothetical protein
MRGRSAVVGSPIFSLFRTEGWLGRVSSAALVGEERCVRSVSAEHPFPLCSAPSPMRKEIGNGS